MTINTSIQTIRMKPEIRRADWVHDKPRTGHPGDLDNAALPVAALAIDYEGASIRPWHHHRRGQLLYAVSGVMQVSTASGTWVVAPQQAVWVPPGIEHQVAHQAGIAMRTLYLDPVVAKDLPRACCVVKVSGLLQQLILRAMNADRNYPSDSPDSRIMLVILDELRALEPEPMHLPKPVDSRLATITTSLLSNPADNRPLTAWAQDSAASERTLARLFTVQTGMTFGEWRERLRLLTAIPRLIDGDSVTGVAIDLGYQSPSAFIAMFKRNTGVTPARFARHKVK